MVESIQTKRQMYELYRKGRFINRPILISSALDANDYPHIPTWTIRGMQKGGSFLSFNIPTRFLAAREIEARAVCGRNYKIAEALNPDDIVFQGELAVDPHTNSSTPYLAYTNKQIVLKYLHSSNPEIATGLKARALIRKYSDCPQRLLDLPYEFGTASEATVVEFTVFRHRCGEFNSNTVVWEVRNGY